MFGVLLQHEDSEYVIGIFSEKMKKKRKKDPYSIHQKCIYTYFMLNYRNFDKMTTLNGQAFKCIWRL